jgi:hypothetical protein
MKKLLIAAVIAFVVVSLHVTMFKQAGAAGPPEGRNRQDPSENTATIDIAVNDAGNVSVGGVALSSLGVGPLDPQVINTLRTLGDLNLQAENEQVTINVDNGELGRIVWDAQNRQAAAALAARYGVMLAPAAQDRIENWISSSNIDLTARFSNEASHAADIQLATPIQLEVAPNGQLTVEGGPLATGIDMNVLRQIQMGGNQAVACWNQGTLTAMVDGVELPTVILNPSGVEKVARALNLPINEVGLNAILDARVGVDLSLPGGAHASDVSCAN